MSSAHGVEHCQKLSLLGNIYIILSLHALSVFAAAMIWHPLTWTKTVLCKIQCALVYWSSLSWLSSFFATQLPYWHWHKMLLWHSGGALNEQTQWSKDAWNSNGFLPLLPHKQSIWLLNDERDCFGCWLIAIRLGWCFLWLDFHHCHQLEFAFAYTCCVLPYSTPSWFSPSTFWLHKSCSPLNKKVEDRKAPGEAVWGFNLVEIIEWFNTSSSGHTQKGFAMTKHVLAVLTKQVQYGFMELIVDQVP